MYVCVWRWVGWRGSGGFFWQAITPPKQLLQAKITEHTPSTLSLTSAPISLSFPHPFHTAPMISQNLTHLCVSTLFQLPDASYIYHYHSVLHSIYMNPNQIWSFGVSLPKLPLILMGSIVLLLPQSIHIQCPDAIIALLRVFQEKLIKSPTPTSLVPLLSYQFPSHIFPFPSPPLPPTSSSSSSHPEY